MPSCEFYVSWIQNFWLTVLLNTLKIPNTSSLYWELLSCQSKNQSSPSNVLSPWFVHLIFFGGWGLGGGVLHFYYNVFRPGFELCYLGLTMLRLMSLWKTLSLAWNTAASLLYVVSLTGALIKHVDLFIQSSHLKPFHIFYSISGLCWSSLMLF